MEKCQLNFLSSTIDKQADPYHRKFLYFFMCLLIIFGVSDWFHIRQLAALRAANRRSIKHNEPVIVSKLFHRRTELLNRTYTEQSDIANPHPRSASEKGPCTPSRLPSDFLRRYQVGYSETNAGDNSWAQTLLLFFLVHPIRCLPNCNCCSNWSRRRWLRTFGGDYRTPFGSHCQTSAGDLVGSMCLRNQTGGRDWESSPSN